MPSNRWRRDRHDEFHLPQPHSSTSAGAELRLRGTGAAAGGRRPTAQGLPGIIGRDGWLARSPLTQGTFLCTLPGITTAMRLDVHFWWNIIETTLLLGAATWFLGGHPPTLVPSWWRAREWWGARRARQGTGASVG